MAIQPPSWVLQRADANEMIDAHGALFLNCFRDAQHWEYSQRTGDMRHPKNIARQAAFNADPIRRQRKHLTDRVRNANVAIKREEAAIAKLRQDLLTPWGSYRAHEWEREIAERTASIERICEVRASREVDLQIFDLLHQNQGFAIDHYVRPAHC